MCDMVDSRRDDEWEAHKVEFHEMKLEVGRLREVTTRWSGGLAVLSVIVIAALGWLITMLSSLQRDIRLLAEQSARFDEQLKPFISAGPRFTESMHERYDKLLKVELMEWVRGNFQEKPKAP